MDLTGKKIMVSDDSILARKQLIDTIKRYGDGAAFVEASNGEEAIEKYKAERPDIAFLDIVMPVKNGIEAVKGIISFDENADICIVSSVGTQTQLKDAIEAGAKDFIQKPISEDQVFHILDAHLGGEA